MDRLKELLLAMEKDMKLIREYVDDADVTDRFNAGHSKAIRGYSKSLLDNCKSLRSLTSRLLIKARSKGGKLTN